MKLLQKASQHLSSLTWVRERQAYTLEQMRGLFGFPSANDFDHLLNELLRDNIIRCKNTIPVTADNLADDAAEYISGRGDYAFAYVGILCCRGHLVYVLPKYATYEQLDTPYSEDSPAEWVDELSLLLRVIQKYKSKYEKELTDAPHSRKTPSYLALMVNIVSDYAETGEYRDDEYLERLNGSGRIMWERTINTVTPYMQGPDPIYMDTISRRLVDAEDHFITRLHRVVVKECCERLHQFGLVQLLNLPMVEAIEDNVETLGEIPYIMHCVESELGSQFDSRRRRILRLLLDYLKEHCYESLQVNATYTFGSNCFNQVWEDVCRCTLGKDVKEQFLIHPPVWEVYAGTNNVEPAAVQSLKLDMLFFDAHTAYVLDAKYYRPYTNSENPCWAGLPGVGDVTKQFLYRQAILSPDALEPINARPKPTGAYNAFLMPQESSAPAQCSVEHFAAVTMPLFPGSRVDAFRLSPEPLYNAYLHGRECAASRDLLRSLLKEKQEGMYKITE